MISGCCRCIEDDGFAVAESGAIVLYLAEKAGKLIPSDVQGRTHVSQWCFAAASTVGAMLMCVDLVQLFDSSKAAPKLRPSLFLGPAGEPGVPRTDSFPGASGAAELETVRARRRSWRARTDSNGRPTDSKSDALSS